MIPIEYGKYYHIYNRGTNGQRIFFDKEDYEYFLNLMTIYLDSVVEIYAYALLGNHFHLLVRIKEESEIGYLNPKYAKSDDLDLKWKTIAVYPQDSKMQVKLKKPSPERMFQHFFSSYAKWVNHKKKRTGSLLEHTFGRIHVDNQKYLRNLLLYIHNNPVKHGFCEHVLDYPWTSYLSLVQIKPSKLSHTSVLGWFDSQADFKIAHQKEIDPENIKQFLFEEE